MALEPTEVLARFRAGGVSRRDILKLLGAIGLTAAAGSRLAPAASAAEDLTMIIWEGYADDAYRIPFEEANDATVTATFAGTGDEMFAAMSAGGGGNYDMVSASSDLPQRLYDNGLLAEIDTTKLTNYNDLYDQFKTPDYITFDGKLYGVNFAWGPTVMLYNDDEITEAPTSWNDLLDEKYSGRIATWNYPLQIAQYALLLDPKPEDPFDLNDEQLEAVKQILIKQKPLVLKYWDYGTDVSQLFASGDILIADGWSWITQQTIAEGLNIKEAIPAEGVTGWSDSWCISKNAKNPDLALKWADWMIGVEGQLGITEVMHYAITNKKAVEQLSEEQRTALRMTDIAADYDSIHMWKFIANYDQWVQVWNEATQG